MSHYSRNFDSSARLCAIEYWTKILYEIKLLIIKKEYKGTQ